METAAGLKQIEGPLSVAGDRVVALKGKLEDLLYRAQRIAGALKNNLKSPDMMYGFDLQRFRRDARALSNDLSPLGVTLGVLERSAAYEENAVKSAQSVLRLSLRLIQGLRALHDTALLAHQHIRTADHKIEAWFIAQEVEEMLTQGQGLPASANRIVIAVSTRPEGAAPPA